jgi:hypothetical protein
LLPSLLPAKSSVPNPLWETWGCCIPRLYTSHRK